MTTAPTLGAARPAGAAAASVRSASSRTTIGHRQLHWRSGRHAAASGACQVFDVICAPPRRLLAGRPTAHDSRVAGFYYAPNAPGTTRFLVDRRRRVLIGCTITGSEIVDFLHSATLAVVGEIPLERIRHAVPPFPTRSELWLSLLEQAGV